MKAQIFTDGAARGNPGPAGIGVVIKSAGKVVLEVSDYIGKTTNNVAEYTACLRGLTEALLLGAKEAELFADSELMVKQIRGEYKVKNEGLSPLFHHLKALIGKFKKFSITHQVREENKHADELANQGIDNAATKDLPLFS
jgi:ribonuclease HI